MNEQNEVKSTEKEPMSVMKFAREVYGWLESFAVTVTVILAVFTLFVRTAYVDGDSMNNTLIDKETLAVSNLFYTPKQGDIVVFQAPDSTVPGGIVKRVIATEGQTVDIDFQSWTVTVDGEVLDEPYVLNDGYPMHRGNVTFPVTVPDGCIFVMGDNRNNSTDSRTTNIGFVDTRYVFGRVLFRITPFDKFGTVK